MDVAFIIAFQAAVIFILLLVGYGLYKYKLLSEATVKQLSNITLTVVNPIIIFNAYQTDFDAELLKGLLFAGGLAIVSHLVLMGAAAVVIRKSSPNAAVERFAMMYSNCGFMGIPLINATFGSEGVLYLTAYITCFNIFMWTHGVIIMRRGKDTREKLPKMLLKALISPAVIAIAIGLLMFFTGVRLPSIIQTPLDYLGGMNTPLAMIVSGATIAQTGLLSGFKEKRVYLVQAFKLLAVPMVLMGLFLPVLMLGVSRMVVSVVLIAAAAPTASSTIMFSHKYKRNAAFASEQFAVSTLLSVVSMPVVLLIFGAITAAMGL